MTPRATALRRLLEDWEAGRVTPIFERDLCDTLDLREEGLVKMFGVRTMRLTEAGVALARREVGGE